MPTILHSGALLVIGGAGGALLTLYLTRRRWRKQGKSERDILHPALSEAEDRRDLLPSTIILVRHGESVGNADSSMWTTMPDNLLPLTDRGLEQSKETGRRVEHILSGRTKSMMDAGSDHSAAKSVYMHSNHSTSNWYSRHSERGYGNGNNSFRKLQQCTKNHRVHLVVSPFERTLQTARAMRTAFEQRIVRTDIESRIREQEFGNVQGDDFRNHREQQKKVGRFWYRFPTGESGADVYDRVKSWWFESVLSVNTRVGYEPIDAMVVVTHGLTMRFVLMQLFSWSPTTLHSVWNADNCEVYVLRKDLTKPGSSPYILDKEAGDIPKSSIELLVEFKSGDKKTYTLNHYLSIPPPRTLRLDIVKAMLAEQHPEEVDISEIVRIEFMPFFDGDIVQGRTPSGASGEKSDMNMKKKMEGHHHHNRTQSNMFSEAVREQGLRRCDSCTCPIPTFNWMEMY